MTNISAGRLVGRLLAALAVIMHIGDELYGERALRYQQCLFRDISTPPFYTSLHICIHLTWFMYAGDPNYRMFPPTLDLSVNRSMSLT